MSKVLVISGHPNLESSYTNKLILKTLNANLPDVEIRTLDSLYPNMSIDVEAEQAALVQAEIVVLQFPFYWYSVPGLMKLWIDKVLSYNFAYGAKGDKLKNKTLILSFTVGGPKDSYDPLGYNHFTIEQLIYPLQQTAYLTGMRFQPPVYTHQMVYIPGVYNTLSEVEERANTHAQRLLIEIKRLTDSPENKLRRFVEQWFEHFDQLPEDSDVFTQYLDPQVRWLMPEGEFLGHQGFRDWYAIARASFKPGCQHQVQQTDIVHTADGYQLTLRVRLIADPHKTSLFQGEPVDIQVKEVWQVSMDEHDQIAISDYQVFPLDA